MIFYFSGTGNSLYIAKNISKNQSEDIISISKEMNLNKEIYEYSLKENEKIIFVFPIYAWAPPQMVLDFINKLKLNNYKNNYTSAIATCGENTGKAIELLSDKLNNITLNSGFSILMPSNYIIIGNVFSKEIESKMLKECENDLIEINKIITAKEKNIFKVEKGPIPKLMTSVINPFFNKFARDTKRFYATDDCIQCGICEKICNSKCIKVNQKPTWSGNCTQCLACINYCPKSAIQYGKSTIKKGRYVNPNITIEETINYR